MKKAKIMLAAIAVFAIVGGAAAFSAKKVLTVVYTQPSGGDCTVTVLHASITNPSGNLIEVDKEANTTTASGACSFTPKYFTGAQ